MHVINYCRVWRVLKNCGSSGFFLFAVFLVDQAVGKILVMFVYIN